MNAPMPSPVKQVALMGRMRGGTTVVRQLIGSASMCFDIGEVFHGQTDLKNNFWGFVGDLGNADPAYRHPTTWPEAWARFVDAQRERFQAGIVVFDAKIDYFPFILRQDGLHDWFFFDSPDTRYILLLRRNLLAQVLSRYRAMHTNTWSELDPAATEAVLEKFRRLNLEHRRSSFQPLGTGVAVDPDDAHAAVDYLARANEAVRARFGDRIALQFWFEDMFDPDGRFSDETVQSIARVCGVDPQLFDRQPVIKRQSEGSVLFGITNRDAVAERFARSPYAWMLGDAA